MHPFNTVADPPSKPMKADVALFMVPSPAVLFTAASPLKLTALADVEYEVAALLDTPAKETVPCCSAVTPLVMPTVLPPLR